MDVNQLAHLFAILGFDVGAISAPFKCTRRTPDGRVLTITINVLDAGEGAGESRFSMRHIATMILISVSPRALRRAQGNALRASRTGSNLTANPLRRTRLITLED